MGAESCRMPSALFACRKCGAMSAPVVASWGSDGGRRTTRRSSSSLTHTAHAGAPPRAQQKRAGTPTVPLRRCDRGRLRQRHLTQPAEAPRARIPLFTSDGGRSLRTNTGTVRNEDRSVTISQRGPRTGGGRTSGAPGHGRRNEPAEATPRGTEMALRCCALVAESSMSDHTSYTVISSQRLAVDQKFDIDGFTGLIRWR